MPDEPNAGEQNVELYTDIIPPPAFPGLSNPTLMYSAYNQPSGAPIMTGGVAIAPGQWVIVIGATNIPGQTAMHNSDAPSGTFSTTIGGIPIDINRCGTQASILVSPGPNTIWSENAFSPSRVEMCALGANIVVRFEYTYGGSFTGDLAIDDICLN